MSRLSLYLLGPPRVERDGVPIEVDTRKAIALLTYLAVTAESQRRAALVNLLWPEPDHAQGLAALRRTLDALTKALADDWLDVGREAVGLRPGADVWVDVDQFRRHLAECQTHGHPATEVCPACAVSLTAAVALYRGDFLSGFRLGDSHAFDEWHFFQAQALRRDLVGALEELVQWHTARREFEQAAAYAKRLSVTHGSAQRERRIVTILFSDVKGSTAMAEGLDPEDVMEIMDGAFDVLVEPITRHEGTLARLMGDAVLAFFGAPIAHEDDPERACHAALEIVDGAQAYAEKLRRERGIEGFNVRVGINTGLVVVGDVGSDLRVEYTAMGDAINLAARMEQNAPPGGILITHDTYRQVHGAFDVLRQEPLQVKGRREPVRTYLVQRARPRAFRKGARGVEGVETRMVGRQAELTRLQETFHCAVRDRELHMVTIVGDAGVGKSRLLHEFDMWSQRLPAQCCFFKGRALQEMQRLPHAMIRDLFAFRFQIEDTDPLPVVREKLEAGIGAALGEEEEGRMRIHFIGHLMGFGFGSSPHLTGVLDDPKQFRDRAVSYLADYFKALASDNPVLILLEDLHWADDSSLDVLNHVALHLVDQPLMIVGTARPVLFERRSTWAEGQSFHRRMQLDPLTRRNTWRLLREILQRVDSVPEALSDLVVAGAEGNPFFVEELIKMLVEDGVIVKGEDRWRVEPSHLSEVRVPPSLRGLLQARLDRLPIQDRTVLQQASVVGRLFWDRAVVHVSQFAAQGVPEAGVLNSLSALWHREIVFQRQTTAFAGAQEYIFKHALLREVTYRSLLKRLRRIYHGLVADWLMEQGGERVGEYSGLIADHLELAGRTAEAIEYLMHAGDRARGLYAHQEAISAYRRAIALLRDTPPDEPQTSREMMAQIGESLGDVLEWTGEHDEARMAYRAALADVPPGDGIWQARLHHKSGNIERLQRRSEQALQAYDLAETTLGAEPAQPVAAWWQEWVQIQLERMWLHYWTGQWRAISELANRIRPTVEQRGTPSQRISFFLSLASMTARRDRYVVSEETLAFCRTALAISLESENLSEIAWARFVLGFNQLWAGDLDGAARQMRTALALAERTGDVVHQSRCLTYLTILYRKLGQLDPVREYASRSLTLATAAQMLEYVGTAQANMAWLAWRAGDLGRTEEQGRAALGTWHTLPAGHASCALQWTALWPLVGVAVARNHVSEASTHARALLDVTQQRLPDALAAVVENAITAWEHGETEPARARLEHAIVLAQELGYL